ncbi:MAG: carbohydrate ABC transporter permease [Armatimonadota bacterium]|nr:carbohydrate ABC transporter permease [Armatimonadota bacterium]MDR5703709.1 carbohydrate ABC transporter permease [Armatimonadota bacterium]
MDLPEYRWLKTLTYLLLTLGLVPMLLPFLWMVSSAFKTLPEVMQVPPTWFPKQPILENFVAVFTQFPFARYILNSVAVAAIVVFGVTIVSAMAGYAFSKFTFPGRDVLFIAMLASLMVPFQVRMIPLYLMSIKFHLVDTIAGLSFPWLFDAFGIFLMRQFMQTIPTELIEAARIDGASELRIFWTILLPLVKPALAALGIFTLVGNWEEFLWPLIVTTSDASRTIPVGLQRFSEQYMSNIHWQMAAATVAVTPLIIAFLLFQRQFIQGIALTGLKD